MTSKAFEQIIKQYGGTVYRVALSRLGNPDSAQDVYQQVFLLLFEKKPQFSCTEQLQVWLMRAAIKYAANERRRQSDVHTEGTVAEAHYTDDIQSEFADLLNTLPESLRDVTLLFYIEDMSVNDVAAALGISRANVKTRLSRARKILEKIYKEELL